MDAWTDEWTDEWTTRRTRTDPERRYNKLTKRSTYEKPPELMTATERADATTNWKECVTGDGRTFYHNRETKARRKTGVRRRHPATTRALDVFALPRLERLFNRLM